MQVVDQALRRGHDVTALVRDPAHANRFDDAVTAVVGDVRDECAVAAALAGVDAVVCCLGVRQGQPPQTVRSEGTATLVEMMRRHGVRRLVAVSSVGVGSSVDQQSRPARLLWPRLVGRERLAEAARAEDVIVAAGDELEWTIVRPPRLVDDAGTGTALVGAAVRTGLGSTLSRARLAAVLLDLVGDDGRAGQAVTATAAR